MKSILSAVFFLLLVLNVSGQEDFEGRIIYRIDAEKNFSADTFTEAFLKKGMALFVVHNTKYDRAGRYLFDFEKGIGYNLNLADSVAFIRNWETKLLDWAISNEKDTSMPISIDNYIAVKQSYIIDSPLNIFLKAVESWFSKEVVFKVPDSMRSKFHPFFRFNENSIALQTTMTFQPSLDRPSLITVRASMIKKETLDDSIFEIPKFCKILPMPASRGIEISSPTQKGFKTTE